MRGCMKCAPRQPPGLRECPPAKRQTRDTSKEEAWAAGLRKEFSDSTQDVALEIFCDHENPKTMEGMGFHNVDGEPLHRPWAGGRTGPDGGYKPDFFARVQHDCSENAAGPQLFVHAELDEKEHRTRGYHNDCERQETIIQMITTQRGPLPAGRLPERGATAVIHDVLGCRVNPDWYVDSKRNKVPGRSTEKLHEKGGPYHLQMLVLEGACKLWKRCPQLMQLRAQRHADADAGGTAAPSTWEPVVAYAYINYSDGSKHLPDWRARPNRMWRHVRSEGDVNLEGFKELLIARAHKLVFSRAE